MPIGELSLIGDYRFQYNGGSERYDPLGWHITPFRPYDPVLGRFHGTDLLAESTPWLTPMHDGMCSPIAFNDPTGLKSFKADDPKSKWGKIWNGIKSVGKAIGQSLASALNSVANFFFDGSAGSGGSGEDAGGGGANKPLTDEEFAAANGVTAEMMRFCNENSCQTDRLTPWREMGLEIYYWYRYDMPANDRWFVNNVTEPTGTFLYENATEYSLIGTATKFGSDIAYQTLTGRNPTINTNTLANIGTDLGTKLIQSKFKSVRALGVADEAGHPATKFNAIVDELIRVRHHTSSEGLAGIKKAGSIYASRAKPYGVDVEVAPFLKPSQVNMGQAGRGSYVEFSVLRSQLSSIPGYMGGTGNPARIITGGSPLNIQNANPTFTRWNWWPF